MTSVRFIKNVMTYQTQGLGHRRGEPKPKAPPTGAGKAQIGTAGQETIAYGTGSGPGDMQGSREWVIVVRPALSGNGEPGRAR